MSATIRDDANTLWVLKPKRGRYKQGDDVPCERFVGQDGQEVNTIMLGGFEIGAGDIILEFESDPGHFGVMEVR